MWVTIMGKDKKVDEKLSPKELREKEKIATKQKILKGLKG